MKPIKKGKTYYFVRREGGRQRWVSLKTQYKEEAVIRLGELLRQRHRSSFGVARDPEDIPWSEMVTRMLDLKRGNGDCPRTIERAADCFKSVERHMEIGMVSDWSGAKLEEFKRLRLASGVAAGTVNKELEVVRATLRKARRWGLMAPSAEDLEDVNRVKDPKKPKYVFSDPGVEHLLASVNAFWRIAVLLGVRAGLRRSEVLHLLWDDVDFEQRVIHVVDRPNAHTKNRKNRDVPLDGELIEPLAGWKVSHPGAARVMPWANETYEGKKAFSRAFSRIRKRLGFPKAAHFHSLRHTFATNLAKAGVSQLKIGELLGHSETSVTDDYTHLDLGDLREAMSRLPVLGKPSNLSSNHLGDNGQIRPTMTDIGQSDAGRLI